jgi:hypothetical protein
VYAAVNGARTAGSARVLGLDTVTRSLEIRRRVGFLPGDLVLYPKHRARARDCQRSHLTTGEEEDRILALYWPTRSRVRGLSSPRRRPSRLSC